MTLFRKEALQGSRTLHIPPVTLPGNRVLARVIAAILATVTVIIVCALTFKYTKHQTLQGQIVPEKGLIRVFAPQSGVVVERLVNEGQEVSAGQLLLTYSVDRQSSSGGMLQENISEQAAIKADSLALEMEKTEKIFKLDGATEDARIAALQNEIEAVNMQVSSQKRRLAIAQENLASQNQLFEKGYIAKTAFIQKQEELLEQEARLQSLVRELLSAQRSFREALASRKTLDARQENQLAQLKRAAAVARQEHAESEAKRRIAIVAPVTGVVTVVLPEIGQAVDSTRLLVAIVPQNSQMRAFLYIPSRAIGFIKAGDKVQLRYQAFPYQKFGRADGQITSISTSAVPLSEISAVGVQGTAMAQNEPVYRASVMLASQTITAYGAQTSIRPGMLLEADVPIESRRIYEWILEPLIGAWARRT